MHKRNQRAKYHRAEAANDADTQRQQTNVDQRQWPPIVHGYACCRSKARGLRYIGHWLFPEIVTTCSYSSHATAQPSENAPRLRKAPI